MNIFNPNSRQMSEEFANLLKYFSDDVEAALKKVYEKVEGISPAEIYALYVPRKHQKLFLCLNI